MANSASSKSPVKEQIATHPKIVPEKGAIAGGEGHSPKHSSGKSRPSTPDSPHYSSPIKHKPLPQCIEETSESEKEIAELQLVVAKQKIDLERAIDHIHYLEEVNVQQGLARAELEAKCQTLIKQYDHARKEKEAAIVKYAISEKNVIEQRNAREHLEKQLRESHKEIELFHHKQAQLVADKDRICKMFDNKVHEVSALQKDNGRLKSELNTSENKMKSLKYNLKTETDAHKEALNRIDELNERLRGAHAEVDNAKREVQEKIRAFQESQENRAYTLDKQLKEITANLILVRHECYEREQRAHNLQLELDQLQTKYDNLLQENNNLTLTVQKLEIERLEMSRKISELREANDKEVENVAELNNIVSKFEQMKLQVVNEQNEAAKNMKLLEQVKQRNSELQGEIEACREREAEMLQFTQILTEKNVRLQSEFSGVETKMQQMSCEENSYQQMTDDLSMKLNTALEELSREKTARVNEASLLAHHVAEKTKLIDQLKSQLDFQKGENAVLKRKLDVTIRQMTKELQQCHKQIEQNETSEPEEPNRSRSNSSSSSQLAGFANNLSSTREAEDSNGQAMSEVANGLDNQTLLNHIVKLQRTSAKKSEKLDFLEEHVNNLISELQKKNRLLQNYMIREQTGALTTEAMDQQKAEMIKSKGIMASMFSSRAIDNNLTLELSLDINKRLQAVLEDTLLKNITLKENVDTLGSEIARLKEENS